MRFIVEAAYLSSQSLDEFVMLSCSYSLAELLTISVVCALVSTSATVEMQGKFAF